jgi:hypothetical protein
MFSALQLVQASVVDDGGFSSFYVSADGEDKQASEKQFIFKTSLEYTGVKFRLNAGRGRAPKGEIDVFTVFRNFLKDCGLIPSSRKNINYDGKVYLTWTNSDSTVVFDCEQDPRIQVFGKDPGWAGNCAFWISTEAPKRVTRGLRAAIAKSTVNVANERNVFNPRAVHGERSKFGAAGNPVVTMEPQEPGLPAPVEVSTEALALFEKIAKGYNFRTRIN